jgi:hypothetical protein
MKSLSRFLGAALLVGLAGLVVLSSPGGFGLGGLAIEPAFASAAIQEQPVEQAAEPLAAPDAPQALKYNDIALVLQVPGVTDAASLASYAGSWVVSVLRFNASTQSYVRYDVGEPDTNFPLSIGDFVFLYVGASPSVLSLVGGVPDQGAVSFALVSGSPAKYNFVSLPLDKGSLAASAVAADIGAGVVRVLRYRSETQTFEAHDVGEPDTDFLLSMGEPLILQLGVGAPARWPQ